MAAALQRLGSQHVLVVHSDSGCDELTLDGPCHVTELTENKSREYTIRGADFGLPEHPTSAVKGATADDNAAILRSVLDGESGPYRDVVLFNSAAALVAADIADAPEDGLARAAESIDSGAASKRMNSFVELAASFA
jgi:anthranilate phosphoribosyltransferase